MIPQIESAEEIRSRVMRFHETALSETVKSPKSDFPNLCDLWRTATRADWVWLWMYNELTAEWELTSHDSAFDETSLAQSQPVSPSQASVSDYVNRTQIPILIPNISTWSEAIGETQFSVSSLRQLEDLECLEFLSVPLIAPGVKNHENPGDILSPIRAAICMHAKKNSQLVRIPDESLILMGRLTAATLRNSYQAEHRDILERLNELAEKFLTTVRRRHGEARKEYLQAIVELIRERVDARGVSVFYQVPFERQKLECLSSTGLADANTDAIIDSEDLSEVIYDVNEGLTGTCFSTGNMVSRVRKSSLAHDPKFVETWNLALMRGVGTVFCPIPRAKFEEITKHDPKAHGVIRCTDPQSPLLQQTTHSFSPTSLKKLAFIARQIAPVLHTFALRVQREFAISIVKHDLETPLSMIRDTAEDIESYIEDDQVVRWHDLLDLKTSALFAQNLLDQLDPDPFEERPLIIEKTMLEGDIVARVRHMLEHFAKVDNDMRITYTGFSSELTSDGTVRLPHHSAVPPLYVDRALIERAIWNLLVNAIKYGRTGSAIAVEAVRHDTGPAKERGVYVHVKNFGMGIRSTDRKRIFRPNYRSNLARQKKAGLGLGLPIARKALDKHGGWLRLTAAASPTVFSLFFPQKLQSPSWKK